MSTFRSLMSRAWMVLMLALAGIAIPAAANAAPDGSGAVAQLAGPSVHKAKAQSDERPPVEVLAFAEYKGTAPDKVDTAVGIFGLPVCPGEGVTYGVYLTVENVSTLGQCAEDGTISYSVSVAGSDFVLADPNTPIVVKDGFATVPGVEQPVPTGEPTRSTHIAQVSYWMQGISFESATAQVPLPAGATLVEHNPDTKNAQLVTNDDGSVVLVLSGLFPAPPTQP